MEPKSQNNTAAGKVVVYSANCPRCTVLEKKFTQLGIEFEKNTEDKLFGLNKIFYEMKKKWGLRTAKEWFEQEFSRGF